MSIDIASLIFEIDSTQAVTARERLDDLEKAGARVDATARKVKSATEMAGIGVERLASATGRAAIAATEHANRQGAAERATRQAEQAALRAAEREASAWARVEAQLERRNAAYRGDLAAQQMRDAERAAVSRERAASAAANAARSVAIEAEKAAQKEAAAWARVEAQIERKNAAYRGAQALATMREEAAAVSNLERRIDALMNSVDPARAAQARLNAELAEASALYKAGAISASDYAKATNVLDARLDGCAQSRANLVAGACGRGGHRRAGLPAGPLFRRPGPEGPRRRRQRLDRPARRPGQYGRRRRARRGQSPHHRQPGGTRPCDPICA